MNFNLRLLMILIFLSMVFSTVFAGETHCWRQDISRVVSIAYDFSKEYSTDPLIVPKEAILNINGFGDYDYRCDNGASGNAINYVEVYDKKTGRVIKNNGINSGGPVKIGAVMCYDNANNIACYKKGSEYVPARGTCDIHTGGMYVGKGSTRTIEISLVEFEGEQEWVIRLGTITPYFNGITPGSNQITFRDLVELNFSVESSKPALLVFPPTPLQKVNTFTLNEDVNKEVNFTLLNKSKVSILIKDYNISCPLDFECFLEKEDDGSNYYNGYTILPNQAMIISAVYSISRYSVPVSRPSTMSVKFIPVDTNTCPLEGCVANSTPLQFQAGLVDQQEFQINVSRQQEQKYCVDSEGRVGRTGINYVPKVNLYFGGNMAFDELGADALLINASECTPLDLNGRENLDWVYCTQKEFLVQLAKRIDLYYTNLKSIKSLESLGRFDDARDLREKNGLISNFSAYLKNQNLNLDNRLDSISKVSEINDEVIFSQIGFIGEQIKNVSELENLIEGIKVNQFYKGVKIDSLDISPGEYDVQIDLNIVNDQMGLLFAGGELNDQLDIRIKLEKKAEPGLNWFFYYQDNDFYDVSYNPDLGDVYTNNYSKRGLIMSFEKELGENGKLKNFYSTYSVPLIIRLVNQTESDLISDSEFKVNIPNHEYETGDIFSIWSGFASSLGEGCESTVNSGSGKKGLPYRVLDKALDDLGNFDISDLNNLKPDTRMYLSTVLYLPLESKIQIQAPFRVYTQDGLIDGNEDSKGSTDIKKEDYWVNTIDSLKDVFEAIENEKVCVIYDNSTGVEKWDLFWNQDKILDQLEQIKQGINDASRCETSELKAS